MYKILRFKTNGRSGIRCCGCYGNRGGILGELALALLAAAIYDSINQPKDFFRGVNDALHPFD
ncbi:MAG: hypothetical protein L3J74_12745 [Bacteroidales bacterium]|nr:hypothetical protein [Bacteroidales bacterium]